MQTLVRHPTEGWLGVDPADALPYESTRQLPALQSQHFDVQTEEGQQARDERNAMERTPGARAEVSVPLPSDLNSDPAAFVRYAYKSAAVARGVPPEFFDKWVSTNVPDGYSLRNAQGNQLTVADTMTPDAYDEKNHSVRLRLDANHLAKIIDDYNASKGLVKRVSDWATSDEGAPGEKFEDVVRPGVRAGAYVLDKAGRVVGALTAAEWSQLRGADQQSGELGAAGTSVSVNPRGVAAMLSALEGDEVPEYARNPVGEAARNSTTLANINPRLPALVGAAGDLVDPLSLVPVEGVTELAEGGRLGRAAEAVGDAARESGLLDRGLVETRPLGLEGAFGDAPRAAPEISTEPKAGMASLGELSPELRAMAEEPEALRYARERQQFYTEQAKSAKDPVARQAAQQNADAYAADVARMEGRELHHSELQPRTDAGQFDGPPRSLPSRVLDTASDIINAPKSIKSSMALHGLARQGAYQIFAHPSYLKDTIASQVKAFASESAYRDFVQSLAERPWFEKMREAGLFMPSTLDVAGGGGEGALMREEAFASRVADRVPGVRSVVRPSERGYLAAMDATRAQAVETYLKDLFGTAETDLKDADPRTLKALASFVNISTGRGEVPILDRFDWGRKAVAAANNVLFSPRALAARANT